MMLQVFSEKSLNEEVRVIVTLLVSRDTLDVGIA